MRPRQCTAFWHSWIGHRWIQWLAKRVFPVRPLFADLLAHAIFLLIEHLLLSLGYVTTVLGRHSTFFPADLMILGVQVGGLCFVPSPSLTSVLMRLFWFASRLLTCSRRG
jgi:hypothetical protein